MDEDKATTRRAIPDHGGTVEPANRASVAKAVFQTPDEPRPAERYELKDPFAEVTYRANTLPEIVAKAEQLGSTRFTAIRADGQRSGFRKQGQDWVREERDGPVRAAAPEQAPGRYQIRSEAPSAPSQAKVVALPGAAARDRTQADPERAGTEAVARIDAQAERAALVARLQTALQERYLIKRPPLSVGEVGVGRTEYRFRGDATRVAFTESTFRLATDTNSPSVARSMVDLAETRNWKALRVSGHEEFRRMVWFEASLRGVKTLGYEPLPSDQAWLRSEREARLVNRIEPARDAGSSTSASTRGQARTDPGSGPGAAATGSPAAAEKGSARGSGGRKAVLAAIEAVLVAKGVPEAKREAVMVAAAEKLAQRVREGQTPKIKIYDKSAPSQRALTVPTTELQRTRDRAAPAPTR